MKLLSFNGFLWIGAAAIILWLLAVPPIMNEWARLTWKQIPCHVEPGDGAFFYYKVNDQLYVSTRLDFWQTKYVSEKRRQLVDMDFSGTCWISPQHPEGAVAQLSFLTNGSEAGKRLMITAFALVVAGGLTWFGNKRTAETK